MKNNFTAVVKKDGDWWIGWVEEVPGVNCQEATREELLESLRITLDESDLQREFAQWNAASDEDFIAVERKLEEIG